MESERCCDCDTPTGRAGRADDSLFCDTCDTGPYCWPCWDDHTLSDAETCGAAPFCSCSTVWMMGGHP